MTGPARDTDDEYVTLGLCDSGSLSEDLSALTSAQIRRAYRAAALIHHPDKPTGSTEQFSRVFLAHETLCDSSRRKAIDAARAARRKRLAERNQLDATRRMLRDKLERDETSSKMDMGMDDAAIARMQQEIEMLRKESTTTTTADMNNSSKVGVEWKGNAWASVAGFTDFIEAKVPFDEFEGDVLANF